MCQSLSGIVGLNNIKENDYLNVVLQVKQLLLGIRDLVIRKIDTTTLYHVTAILLNKMQSYL